MYFDNLHAALVMDGHGAFVWAAYGITAVVVICLLLVPVLRGRRLRRELAGDIRRREMTQTGRESPHASST